MKEHIYYHRSMGIFSQDRASSYRSERNELIWGLLTRPGSFLKNGFLSRVSEMDCYV